MNQHLLKQSLSIFLVIIAGVALSACSSSSEEAGSSNGGSGNSSLSTPTCDSPTGLPSGLDVINLDPNFGNLQSSVGTRGTFWMRYNPTSNTRVDTLYIQRLQQLGWQVYSGLHYSNGFPTLPTAFVLALNGNRALHIETSFQEASPGNSFTQYEVVINYTATRSSLANLVHIPANTEIAFIHDTFYGFEIDLTTSMSINNYTNSLENSLQGKGNWSRHPNSNRQFLDNYNSSTGDADRSVEASTFSSFGDISLTVLDFHCLRHNF